MGWKMENITEKINFKKLGYETIEEMENETRAMLESIFEKSKLYNLSEEYCLLIENDIKEMQLILSQYEAEANKLLLKL